MRSLLARFEIKHQGQSLGKLTASFGVANFPLHGEDAEDIIRAADAALYQAKAGGRNQVVIYNGTISYEEPLETGQPANI